MPTTLARTFAALSAICAATQVAVYGSVALGAAGIRQRLVHSADGQLMLGRGVALLLVATAVWALWHSWQRV